ncbi:MAG: hypothetical protein S4CHLAM45_09410 [Chlamydiales bacterium]|nr:hypothetical protein [Chlamydiales bacterium]MCH9620092.1 hypothetical protein [Chlamydiales bacterium]MCH9623045.1 hypothetical protein [Chlamydiales bacterium]
MLKRYFVTGLIILLPVALTIVILSFFINILTAPFVGFFEHFLEGTEFYQNYQGFVHFLLQIFFLFALAVFTVLLGFLARIVVFKSLLSLYDYFLHRIPIIKTIYKTSQQVIKTLFGSSSRSFKQVVMVPFPTQGGYCIGLVSSPAPSLCTKTIGKDLVTVFVPTTPNPTSGYLIMYEDNEVVYLDMKVEDAVKYIISCGVLSENQQEPLAKKP